MKIMENNYSYLVANAWNSNHIEGEKYIYLSTAYEKRRKLLFGYLQPSEENAKFHTFFKELNDKPASNLDSLYLVINVRDIDRPPNHVLSLSHARSAIHPPLPINKAIFLLQIATPSPLPNSLLKN